MSTGYRARTLLLFGLFPLAGVVTGCMTSRPPQSEPRATTPYGETASVTLVGGRRFDGELIAVTDSSWILMVNQQVATVRHAALRFVFIKSIGFMSMSKGPSPAQLKRAGDAARFPRGAPAGALAIILAKTGQTEPVNLESVPR